MRRAGEWRKREKWLRDGLGFQFAYVYCDPVLGPRWASNGFNHIKRLHKLILRGRQL
jgi:hypothetical protein